MVFSCVIGFAVDVFCCHSSYYFAYYMKYLNLFCLGFFLMFLIGRSKFLKK